MRFSEEVEGSGAEQEEFDEKAAINDAVSKVTELVTNWADNVEEVDLKENLEINEEENEITPADCTRCRKRSFRMKNSELCSRCSEPEETTALTTPKLKDSKTKR